MSAAGRMRIARAFALVLIGQLVIGTLIIVTLHAQAPDTIREQQQLADAIQELDRRVTATEALHIEARLAVVDALNDRSWKIEMLVLGGLATTAGSVLLQFFQLKKADDRRHSPGRRHADAAD